MLEIRPVCEHCAKPLPNGSSEAMICSFECTFCRTCVKKILRNVCPNCGGGFEKRPSRPQSELNKYPIKATPFVRPIDPKSLAALQSRFEHIAPEKR